MADRSVDAAATGDFSTAVEMTTIDRLAMIAAAEILTISNLEDEEAFSALHQLQPDLFIAACFPHKLPAALLALPALGAYNIHPSLLPRWRGPDPLFWTFQAGDQETGVSIHQMTTAFDAGPLVAQQPIALPETITLPQLELLLATTGAAMMADLLPAFEKVPVNSWPQPETGVAHAPLPHNADWIAAPGWTVTRALQFIQGVATDATPVTVTSLQGDLVKVSRAILARSPASEKAPPGYLFARFSNGYLVAKVAAGGKKS